jgi:hypothetical protein
MSNGYFAGGTIAAQSSANLSQARYALAGVNITIHCRNDS